MVGFNSEMEQMKERFAKLLLGEDMSGGGKGVSSALALSNAFTNLAGMLLMLSLAMFHLLLLHLRHEQPNVVVCLFVSHSFLTDYAAAVFGEQKRLEPMPPERKARWRKEIDWLLSVTDYIVEMVPVQQKNKDGTVMEVTNQPSLLPHHLPHSSFHYCCI